MEGVSTVMPLAVKTGLGALGIAHGNGGGDPAAEARARNLEAQARRQAEAVERGAREEVRQVRETGQHAAAAARVAAADSGLNLSGSTLLSLTGLEHAADERQSRILAEAGVRAQALLDAGAEQARSIRLSGRAAANRSGGLGSLLRLGGQAASGGAGGYPNVLG